MTASALFLALLAPPAAKADICMSDLWGNGTIQGGLLFPNWDRVHVGSFDSWLCLQAWGCDWVASERIVGLTVVNFGSATNADLDNVYWRASCPGDDTGLLTMTYAGMFVEDSGTYPAWTWVGSTLDLSGCPDMCGGQPCGAYFTIDIYADITACPDNAKSLIMGFPVNSTSNTSWWGSIWDNAECAVPWVDTAGPRFSIAYTHKIASQKVVAPGDTVDFTVYYGRPGTTALSNIVIVDTQPPYTHYLDGSASVAPDPGWAPNPGPPLVLRWTLPGPWPILNGPTGELTFKLSVDWGNGEGFEPGSGDVAAPEGVRLENQAHVFFEGTDCPASKRSAVNPPVSTVVRRFLFWKIGDNDVLFSTTYGQPPDEMIYEIFLMNMSTKKTWWDVRLWDTVPDQLDAWGADCGFTDPCVGWTMTPTGCAAAYPGAVLAGGKTILTWHLDMPPLMTLAIRWKAKVRNTAEPEENAINQVSIQANGWTGVVEGTGNSIKPRIFTHLAPIILPTIYVSYVGYGLSELQCPGYFLDFFPLNKKTQFELRAFEAAGVGTWADDGGVSPSIATFVGDCLGGFPGGGGYPGGGIAGCKAERTPALYSPTIREKQAIGDCIDAIPHHFIYKLTSNSPVLWQMLTYGTSNNQDNHTYAPSTTLTYTGLMHYFWRRTSPTQDWGYGDCMTFVNTSMDPYGTFNADLATTMHLFRWDYTFLQWEYIKTYEIDKESAAHEWTTKTDQTGPYRSVSSDTGMIVNQGMMTNSFLATGGHADNFAAYMPTRETGNVVSTPGEAANFYGILEAANQAGKIYIGNVGAADATYRIFRYVPKNTTAPARFPFNLADTSGTWVSKGTHMVPAGLANAGNPRIYPAYGPQFFESNQGLLLYKVELVEGGPIQILHGFRNYSVWAGGAVMHSADGNQTGIEYWLHHGYGEGDKTCVPTYTIDVFCPKEGTGINATTEDGLDKTYTTDGPDQCVAFTHLSQPAASKRNYLVTVTNPAQGNVIAQFIQCTGSEKGYTAPFLTTGTHYRLIAPPVVYKGASFWITVVVIDVGGVTKTNYDGTTSFTSTDPLAQMEWGSMEASDYTWVGGDNGVRIFLNVTFDQLGLQTIIANDILDGSITGLVAFMVVATDVKLTKRPPLTVAASGDIVEFKICWSTYSGGSANNFTITDAVPDGTKYTTSPIQQRANHFCGATNGFSSAMVAYSTTGNDPNDYTDVPVGGTTNDAKWLKWTIPSAVGVNTSGCVCFKVTVD